MGLWYQASWSKKVWKSQSASIFQCGHSWYFCWAISLLCRLPLALWNSASLAAACQMPVASPFIVTKETSLLWTSSRGAIDQTLEPIGLSKEEDAIYCWSKTSPADLQSRPTEPEQWGTEGGRERGCIFWKLYHLLTTLKSKVWPYPLGTLVLSQW